MTGDREPEDRRLHVSAPFTAFLSTFVTSQVTVHVRVSFWTMLLPLFYLSLCASTTIGPIHQKTLLRMLTTISLKVLLVYKSSPVWGTETQKPSGRMGNAISKWSGGRQWATAEMVVQESTGLVPRDKGTYIQISLKILPGGWPEGQSELISIMASSP